MFFLGGVKRQICPNVTFLSDMGQSKADVSQPAVGKPVLLPISEAWSMFKPHVGPPGIHTADSHGTPNSMPSFETDLSFLGHWTRLCPDRTVVPDSD